MKLINAFFEYTGIILIFINTLLYLISYKSHKKIVAYKVFSWYLMSSFIISLAAFILAKLIINNLFLSHLYFISQFVFLTFFYKFLFNPNQQKKLILILILVLSILTYKYVSEPSLFYRFNLTEIFMTSFPLVVYSIIHLYNSISKSSRYMYINAGILIYIATSTLIFILGDYLSLFTKNQAIKNIWLINKVLYVIYMILILIEWKKNFRPVKSK
jgi:hypothetical protein